MRLLREPFAKQPSQSGRAAPPPENDACGIVADCFHFTPMQPPTGDLTFLFSDIEGSSQLWEKHPQAMAGALAQHDALLRGIFVEHGGYAFKTMGDAFCVAFDNPLSAAAAALAVQCRLAAETWGERGRCACAWRCTAGRRRNAMVIILGGRSIASRGCSRRDTAGKRFFPKPRRSGRENICRRAFRCAISASGG